MCGALVAATEAATAPVVDARGRRGSRRCRAWTGSRALAHLPPTMIARTCVMPHTTQLVIGTCGTAASAPMHCCLGVCLMRLTTCVWRGGQRCCMARPCGWWAPSRPPAGGVTWPPTQPWARRVRAAKAEATLGHGGGASPIPNTRVWEGVCARRGVSRRSGGGVERWRAATCVRPCARPGYRPVVAPRAVARQPRRLRSVHTHKTHARAVV